MEEKIYIVHWEGPFPWNTRKQYIRANHVLYAIYGTHPLYGLNVLLYLGKGEGGVNTRLDSHDRDWMKNEYDYRSMTVRLASVGKFIDWDTWDKEKLSYPAPYASTIVGVESLLIHAYQPAYCSMEKEGLRSESRGMRIFNTGDSGMLLPEVSYLYLFGDTQP
jgi:hypothetical protein